jgi:hypothetical protein
MPFGWCIYQELANKLETRVGREVSMRDLRPDELSKVYGGGNNNKKTSQRRTSARRSSAKRTSKQKKSYG